MKILKVFFIAGIFGLCGCFPQVKKTPRTQRKKTLSLTVDQKVFLKKIEETSVRYAALEHNITCENVKALQNSEPTSLGMAELLEFIAKECDGQEPLLPQRLPAKCRDQVEIPQDSLGAVPGLEVRAEDVRQHNMSQCRCAPEYKLIEESQEPVCHINIPGMSVGRPTSEPQSEN